MPCNLIGSIKKTMRLQTTDFFNYMQYKALCNGANKVSTFSLLWLGDFMMRETSIPLVPWV